MELWQQARAEFVDVIDWSEDGSDTLAALHGERIGQERSRGSFHQDDVLSVLLDLAERDIFTVLVRLARDLL